MRLPAAEEDVFGLFDDFLQQPLAMLQVGDFRLVVGQRPSQPEAFVPKGGAGWVRHHHRAQLLLVELEHDNQMKPLEIREGKRGRREEAFYLSHHLMQIVFQNIKAVIWFWFLWRYSLVLLFTGGVAQRDGELQTCTQV